MIDHLTQQQRIAWRIAAAAGKAEGQFQRAIGAPWQDAYHHNWRVFDEVFELAFAPEGEIELGRLKTIVGIGQ